ncbi:MFS transporter [Pseudomonas sp. DCB_CB]|uniref:MFS transporter n=1 Tax=unclassified Pseudomonas TaxID=196821 RepID=UPI0022496A3D|nr:MULTISPECIES: MFS transporter [unclassified Pseudomonas]MCX2695041.1 MFS transporter [Pseudomonas sp. DCB_BZ]MCX2860119.1 MFS transporter [Pseudomonas sp. DCB_CB]
MTSTVDTALQKVTLRLIPYLLLLYVVAYIDRANISFAALEMNASLGFDASIYGLAAGIFFIGYFIFEVPSNILLAKFGAKIWIARILMSWGVVVILTGFVQNATQLHILRFLLGLAEAGLFPGLIYYMASWFPKKSMAKNVAMFMSAIPVAYIIGGPISGWLIDNVTGLSLEGWRWMFIIEGAAAVVLAPITYFYLTDSPPKAHWLTEDEKQALLLEVNAGGSATMHEQDHSAFTHPTVWYLSALYFFYISGTLGLMVTVWPTHPSAHRPARTRTGGKQSLARRYTH